ncbi:hypothetical protein H312_02452 [Anncaliia algerae PRA339]|uniref:EamA domain-containing protein n=1 Tax=Anncaliia algerae PRA339 TaxID=1288291 RepID=A0A059EZ16_9MICR|nr:hypothetical protein H312_02452 [Anncaliia algerae PRA339]
MTKKKGLFDYKFIKLLIFILYFVLGVFYAYYARKHSGITNEYAHHAVLFDGLVLTVISLCISYFNRKNSNKYNIKIVVLMMVMFFFASKLYMNCLSNLSAFVVSIFTQSRVIVTFVFSAVILRKKFYKSELLGIIIISLFILLISYVKSDENSHEFKLNFALLASFSSALSGLSSCLFDSEVKEKIFNYSLYSLQSNLCYFLVALIYHLIHAKTQDINVFNGFNNKKFYIIASISSSISAIAMLNCFCFSVVERMIMSFISKIVSDLIIDIILKNEIGLVTAVCYIGVIIGSLIFKFYDFTEYFTNKQKKVNQ